MADNRPHTLIAALDIAERAEDALRSGQSFVALTDDEAQALQGVAVLEWEPPRRMPSRPCDASVPDQRDALVLTRSARIVRTTTGLALDLRTTCRDCGNPTSNPMRPDPYAQDIGGDDTPVRQCDDCYQISSDDC